MILIPVGAFFIFLLFASVDDYKPEDKTNIPVKEQALILGDSTGLDLLIWNIGYAGLDASMDFFYDGGEQMRPSEEGVSKS